MDIAIWPTATASEADQQGWYDIWAAVYREQLPDEPVPPHRAAWFWVSAHPECQSRTTWRAVDESGRLAGWTTLTRNLRGTNQDRVSLDVQVAPAARRRGIGTALVRRAARVAREEGARVVGFETSDAPGPVNFLTSLGAIGCLADIRSVLDLGTLDLAVVQAGAQRPAGAAGYSLVRWGNDMTTADLADLARVSTVMNTAPRGDLTANDEEPDTLVRRQWLEHVRDAGDDFITVCARDDAGDPAGFTMVRLNTSTWPGYGFQEDTGVDPAHRGHGLGLWLKCVMLQHLLQEFPDLRRLETWNAAENEHMLRINRLLGFRATVSGLEWELSGPALDKLAG